jgi:hypothetical protein
VVVEFSAGDLAGGGGQPVAADSAKDPEAVALGRKGGLNGGAARGKYDCRRTSRERKKGREITLVAEILTSS